MNPQDRFTLFLTATQHVRPMKGGAQSHMLIASDRHAYVVKFANNPQSPRVLANEWLACRIGRELGLTIPKPAIVSVPPELVDSSPDLVVRIAGTTLKCKPGLAFGSRVIAQHRPIFDYLPEPVLAEVENLSEFAGVLALDKWLCNCDGRQVVFCRTGRQRKLWAHFIDFGFCFNADEWNFPDSPLRGVYTRNLVYQNVCGMESFQPWLSRIEHFSLSDLQAIAAEVPHEWAQLDRLAALIERLHARRELVRHLIEAVRNSPRLPFGNWN